MSRLIGRNWMQNKELCEVIRKGEEYVLFKGVNGDVHILPEKKLQAVIKKKLDNIRTIMQAYESLLVKGGQYEHCNGKGAISSALDEAGLIKEL